LIIAIDKARLHNETVQEDQALIEFNLFDALLMFEYKDNLDLLVQKNLIERVNANSLGNKKNSMYSELSVNAYIHNIGLLCAFSLDNVPAILGNIDTALQVWLEKHMSALTYKVRKASYLGLLNIARNYEVLQNYIPNLELFLLLLLKETIVLSIQKRKEEEDDDCDIETSSSENEEEEKMGEANGIEDLLREDDTWEVERRLNRLDSRFMMEGEILLTFDCSYIRDSANDFDTTEIAKSVFLFLEGKSPGLVNSLLTKLPTNLVGEIKKLLA
jgi:hypothetical protein